MLPVVLTMLIILVVCGAVVAYVAFPHRGEDLPGVPGLGQAMRRGVDALPTLDPDQEQGQEQAAAGPAVPAQRHRESVGSAARD